MSPAESDRERLRQRFNESFATWKIELPAEALQPDQVWLIVEAGWTIWARFYEADAETGAGERLDYYAMHRMTSDSHVRLHAGGESEGLPTVSTAYVLPPNASEAEAAAARDRNTEQNRAVAKMLAEKGFVMTGDVHPSAAVNRRLALDPDA